jgi:O-antigen/teichoic acid export membrane protein
LQRELWHKLLPFAASVWATNWLANLFDMTDRWMIVQCSGMAAADSLAAVGNYHAARLLPLPLLGVAAILRSAVLPHLSHDWELGRHDDVSDKLNLTLKLWGLATLAVSATLLLAGPFIFEIAFQGKYAQGLAVLPLTMAYMSWAGAAAVASSYLWCAERAGLASLPLLLGLIANISLNLVLVPMFGLPGAVMATAAANALALALMRWLSENLGLKRDSGVWVVCGALLLLSFGAAAACIGLLLLLHQALQREWLLNSAERRQIAQVWSSWRNRTSET